MNYESSGSSTRTSESEEYKAPVSEINNLVDIFGSLKIKMTTPSSSATTPVVEMLNALKIPDGIKTLPTFEGNPKLLFDFIQNVEEILEIVKELENSPVYKFWLRAIRNKVVGQANEVLNTYGTNLVWKEIRENLISHYSDKRSETILIKDLYGLVQNNTIEGFYSQIIEINANLTNQLNIHEENSVVVKSKSILYAEMCLQVFLTGLIEPMGSIIRARNPSSLKEAFAYCICEQNINYAKRSKNPQLKKPFQPTTVFKPNYNYPQQFNRLNTSNFLPRFNQPNMYNNQPKINQPNTSGYQPKFNQSNTPGYPPRFNQVNNSGYQQNTSNFPRFNQPNNFSYQPKFNQINNSGFPRFNQTAVVPMDIDPSGNSKFKNNFQPKQFGEIRTQEIPDNSENHILDNPENNPYQNFDESDLIIANTVDPIGVASVEDEEDSFQLGFLNQDPT